MSVNHEDAAGLHPVIMRTVAAVLGLQEVLPSDNFFVLGGDSLGAMMVVARLQADHGVDASLRLLLESPSLGAFAEAVVDAYDHPLESSLDEDVELNRRLWNTWAPISEASEYYDLESFRSGRIDVRDYEIAELGDVTGRSLLHLMCHIGTDTLSWARLGATVTGVDVSDEAIAIAQRLADDVGVNARFIRSDVNRLDEVLVDAFDIVYTSRGVMWWVPDLARWGRMIAQYLAPGGVFYMAEIHPVATAFQFRNAQPGELRLTDAYFSREGPVRSEFKGSYASPDAETELLMEASWPHGLGEIVTALAQGGLRIEFLHERPFVEWPVEFLVEDGEKRHVLPRDIKGELPLSFSLLATKR
jgi:SAM-dependent methyltransferase